MDNQVHSAAPLEQDEVVRVAEAVRQDLHALLGILERQLKTVSGADDQAQAHLEEAKSAAERGIELSGKLVDMLRFRS